MTGYFFFCKKRNCRKKGRKSVEMSVFIPVSPEFHFEEKVCHTHTYIFSIISRRQKKNDRAKPEKEKIRKTTAGLPD